MTSYGCYIYTSESFNNLYSQSHKYYIVTIDINTIYVYIYNSDT